MAKTTAPPSRTPGAVAGRGGAPTARERTAPGRRAGLARRHPSLGLHGDHAGPRRPRGLRARARRSAPTSTSGSRSPRSRRRSQLSREEVADLEAQRERWTGPRLHHDAGARAAVLRPARRGRLPRRRRPAARARAPGAGAGERRGRGRRDADWMSQLVRSVTEAGLAQTVAPVTVGVPDPDPDAHADAVSDARPARPARPPPRSSTVPGAAGTLGPQELLVTTPPFPPVSDADLAVLREQLGRPARGVVGIAARCVCGNPTVVATSPRLPDGTPFPTFYYLTHPAATAAMSVARGDQVMRELYDELADDEELAAAYARAHEAYLARPRGVRRGRRDRRASRRAACRPASSACTRSPGTRSPPVPASIRSATARSRCRRGRPSAASAPSRGRADDPAAARRRRLGGRRRGSRRRRPGGGPAAPAPAEDDPVRAAEYWLDDYGIEKAWETTRGAGVTIADHRHRHRPRTRRAGRAPSSAARMSPGVGSSDGRTPRRRGRRRSRQLGRLPRRRARHRARTRA